MATEPTNLPQFHRAQTQLQTGADTEWQRALLERLRVVCREEMMDVMKSLVDSGHVTPALEEKLTAMEESSKHLQEDVRQSASLARGAVWKAVLITAMISIFFCAAGVAALYFVGGASIITADTMKAQQQKTQLTTELQQLNEQKGKLSEEVDAMAKQHQALTAEMKKSTEAQRALAANLGTLEQQFKKLQQVQEQFRFKMVKGEAGGAFVEVAPDSKAFDYNGKFYIQVK